MARFLVFMATAGVIAVFGVIDVNPILTIGATAVSPNALPVGPACVGIVRGGVATGGAPGQGRPQPPALSSIGPLPREVCV